MNKYISLLGVVGMLSSLAAASAAEPESGASPARATTPESFQIRNKKFGQLLRPEDANGADGTRIVLYPAQSWKCLTWKLHAAGEGAFQLQNHFTSKTFASTAQAAVTQVPFSKEAGERPTWRFAKLPGGFYRILELKSGKALTAVAAGDGGARIVVAPAGQGDEQQWELIKTDPAKLTM